MFDVDIEDGAPPLKLPYNLSQNPYEAATKFIHDNELPISYLDQVANFITTNTQGATIGNTSQPSQPDPWGSDARYRPEDANASVSNADPPRPPPSAKLLPQKTYLAITNTALPKLFAKIEETNAGLLSSGQKDVCLNPEGLSTLRDLQAYLEKKERSTSIPNSEANSPTVVDDAFPIISTVATRWPYAQRLPGLDLLRLLASEMTVVSHQSANETNIITLLMKSVKPSEGLSSKNHLMMFIRFCANIFQTSKGRAVAIEEWRPIWVIIENTINDIGKGDRNVAVAATTVWINYAVLITQATAEIPDGFELALGVLEAAQAALQRETDAEVVFRALVAIGTLLEAGVDEVKTAARDVLTIGSTVQKVRDASAEKRIGDLAMEIMTLLA